MKRRSIFMDDERYDKLKDVADKKSLKVSELIRRIIDEWLKKRK